MAAKPGTLLTWDTNATNTTAPSAGQLTDGAATNAILASGVFNYLFNLLWQWIVYLSDGIFQHSIKTHQIPASAGQASYPSNNNALPQTWTFVGAASAAGTWEVGSTPGGSGYVSFSICLDVGSRIRAVRAYVHDTNDASGALTMQLLDTPATGSTTQLGSDVVSAANGTDQTLTLSGRTDTLQSGHNYVVRIRAGSADTNNQIRLVEVDYDRVTS